MSQENANEVSGQNASKVNWDEDFKPREKGAKSRPDFLALNKQGKYTVRLVGSTYKFNRYWDPFDAKARVIVAEEDFWNTKAAKAGFLPRTTYVTHLIDRSTGKLMLLEKGKNIFGSFAEYKEINGVSPASPNDAPEFVISVSWVNGDKRQATYKVTAKTGSSPLTAEEKALYEAGKVDLGEYYKSTPLSKIDEMFDALPAEKKIKPPKQKKDESNGGNDNRSSSRQAEPIREADTSNGNDAFGDDNKDSSDF